MSTPFFRVEDVIAPGHAEHLADFLLDQEHRYAFGVDLGDRGKKLFADPGGEAGRGLVDERHHHVGDDRQVPERARVLERAGNAALHDVSGAKADDLVAPELEAHRVDRSESAEALGQAISQGRIIGEGAGAALMADETLRAGYLGL